LQFTFFCHDISSVVVVKISVRFCLSRYEFTCACQNLNSFASITILVLFCLSQFQFICVYRDLSSLTFVTLWVRLCLLRFLFICDGHNFISHVSMMILVHILSHFQSACVYHGISSHVFFKISVTWVYLNITSIVIAEFQFNCDYVYISSFVLFTISFHLCQSRYMFTCCCNIFSSLVSITLLYLWLSQFQFTCVNYIIAWLPVKI
jgi:hypothetical protein